MWKGNLKLKIERMTEGHDIYGQPITTTIAVSHSRCSVVRLATERLRTSVRTDTSATGGNAHEMVADARLLVELNTDIKEGDILTVQKMESVRLRVDQIFVRNDVHGRGHHWQVDCSIWDKS